MQDAAIDLHDPSIFRSDTPPFSEVLAVRAERVAMVRDHLATVTADDLSATRQNPWAP